MAGRRQIPHRLGDDATGQCPAILPGPTRTGPHLIDEALHLDEIESCHEALVRLEERTDRLGQRREKVPLKSVPEIE